MFAKQLKANPHSPVNLFNVNHVDVLNLLTTNEERKIISPKKDVKLTGFDEGLTLIDKAGISIILGTKAEDVSINSIPVEEMTKEQTKEMQLKLENILDKI